jgi:predicted  nucleic acid-binding Zn-ribbon protein
MKKIKGKIELGTINWNTPPKKKEIRTCLKCGKETLATPCPYCGNRVFKIEIDSQPEKKETKVYLDGQEVKNAVEFPQPQPEKKEDWEEKLKPKVIIEFAKYQHQKELILKILNIYWEKIMPKIRQLLVSEKLKSYEEGREEVRAEISAKLDVAQKKWTVCKRKNCDNKEECERANHYIKTIWNPTFKELLNQLKTK